MVKFMILFRQPEDIDKFENVYQNFLALVERIPHIQRRQVVHVTGSPQGAPEFYRILELYFESSDMQTEALMSPAGQEAGGELNRFESGSFQLLLTDVYEEAGSSTPQAGHGIAADSEPAEAADDLAPEAAATKDESEPAETADFDTAKAEQSEANAAEAGDEEPSSEKVAASSAD